MVERSTSEGRQKKEAHLKVTDSTNILNFYYAYLRSQHRLPSLTWFALLCWGYFAFGVSGHKVQTHSGESAAKWTTPLRANGNPSPFRLSSSLSIILTEIDSPPANGVVSSSGFLLTASASMKVLLINLTESSVNRSQKDVLCNS